MAAFQHILATAPLPAELRGGVVAIGNFDGVHRGHQAVLERALAEARRRGVPALVLTFEPHPRKIFRPDMPLFVLTPPPMKARLLSLLGFAALVEQPFTRDFASLSAEAFVTDVLERNLGITHAVTGFDFHFGKDRQGGPAYLMAAGERHGFGVTLVDAFRDEGAEVVSSSRIRGLLERGRGGRGRRPARLSLHRRKRGGGRPATRPHAWLSNREYEAFRGSRAQGGHLCRPLSSRRRHASRRCRQLRPSPDRRRQWRAAAGNLRLRFLRRPLWRDLPGLLLRFPAPAR